MENGSREDKQAVGLDSVIDAPIMASREMFVILRRLSPKQAAVALALLTLKFYEAAAELGPVEDFMKSLSAIVIEEHSATA